MLFNSLIFLFAFLPVTYLTYWSLKTTRWRQACLTISGYIFYGYWGPRYCLLMAFTTLVSYCAGRGLLSSKTPHARRFFLIAPITIDLTVLAFFKYAGFFARSVDDVFTLSGFNAPFPILSIVLPIGISFYTFHTITYIVDAYRGVIKPTRSLWEYAAYVSLFAQLVAGPIVRFRQIESDLEAVGSAERKPGLAIGLSFLAFGMMEKVIIADSLSRYVDPALENYRNLSCAGVWLAMVGYSLQLYFDFSGYSSMAVGLGRMFGLRIPQNFNSPYRATSPSDFWKRWHISLSTVLRDYLFMPLSMLNQGRGSKAVTFRNLMITMSLGGLWHGANWTFVLWGVYSGLLLAVHNTLSDLNFRLPRPISQLLCYICVVVLALVLFRSTDLSMAGTLYSKMLALTPGVLPADSLEFAALVLLSGVLAYAGPNAFEFHRNWQPTVWHGVLASVVLASAVAVIAGARPTPFLYYQF